MRFTPSRTYLSSAAVAFGLAAFSAWCGLNWWPAFIAAGLFLMGGGLTFYMAMRPAIEVSEAGLAAGKTVIDWLDVRRVDQTGWISPMVVDLTLVNRKKVRLIYPGETANSNRLLRVIQQRCSLALINGVPWRRIFGAPAPEAEKPVLPSPRYRLLTEDDEAEVERLYHQLRTAGRFDTDK
jgi:hypothetical protein